MTAGVLPEVSARVTAAGLLGSVPLYGSPAWHELPADDPRRSASVWRAAECWRLAAEPERLVEQLRIELVEADVLARWRLRMLSADVSAAADWSQFAQRHVTHAELRERRGEVA